jgi:hypothetical protein
MNSKPTSAILHGCFGRYLWDPLQAINFHLPKWTLVRNKRNGGRNEKILKLNFGICNCKTITEKGVNFEVAPEQRKLTRAAIDKF